MSKRILIVDDEPNILKSLSGPLGREGYTVETAADFADAVGANDGSFDVLLLDVWLPDGDGVKLLQQFKKDYPDQAIIMMSGHSTIGTAVSAVKLGAFDFLEKPLSLEKVLVTIENAIHFLSLKKENVELRKAVEKKYELIGASDAIRDVQSRIQSAATSNARILIRGESGTGKEIVARLIHIKSNRSRMPFVAINCAAVPDELIESELFGHRKGAFTGAVNARVGRFEKADGGTLFLDEIGDMNLRTQAKLLRVIEDGEVEILGGGSVSVDVRIISATNRNLEGMIADEKFREDLFFRLNVYPIDIPPLRFRKDDIPLLVEHFVSNICSEYGRKDINTSKDAMKSLMKFDYRGNVRELANLVERILIGNDFSNISADDVKDAQGASIRIRSTSTKLKEATEEFESEFIQRVIKEVSGNMTEAAARLGLERSHLYKKMSALGLKRDQNH
ncbi:MAG: sigma-54 dependent transcriptional regulator [Candidatus Zixiibacteriota bacterium]